MSRQGLELIVVIKKPGSRIVSKVPLKGMQRVVVVYNRQFTNAPNTTQIASGAGKSSAAGSNAAIASPDTFQQESIGAGGKAMNKGQLRRAKGNRTNGGRSARGKEAIIVVNDQVVKLVRRDGQASATQIASGAGKYSTGGTNSAINSPRTKQQQAVGGGSGGVGVNKLSGKRKGRRSR